MNKSIFLIFTILTVLAIQGCTPIKQTRITPPQETWGDSKEARSYNNPIEWEKIIKNNKKILYALGGFVLLLLFLLWRYIKRWYYR